MSIIVLYIVRFKYYSSGTILMGRKTTSLKVDEELWKQVKIHSILENMDISDYIEKLIKKDMKKNGNKKN